MGRVLAVGSVNVDEVIETPAVPRPGETVLAHGGHRGFGGKGANQAAAAARYGAPTWLVAAVGDDADGAAALADLHAFGVDTTHVRQEPGSPTGRAVVLLDDRRENAIVVVPGANGALAPGAVSAALAELGPSPQDVVLVSAEIPPACVGAAARSAVDAGAWLVHNLAPARALAEEVAGARSVLVVNEIEARQVAGTDDLEAAFDVLLARVGHAVVTLGGDGAEARSASGERVAVPATAVEVVDTTGAGDAFCGALAAELAAGGGIGDAVTHAVAAAGVAVTGRGARGALAHRADVR